MNNEHYYFFIEKNEIPFRIDNFLLKNMPYFTRSKIQDYFYTEKIFVNNFVIKKNYKIIGLDIIRVLITYSIKKIISKEFLLNIIYEDDIIIVIDKKYGLLVQDNFDISKISLLHRIKFYLNNIGVLSPLNRIGLVHRLDKGTSGLLLIAKNDFSFQHLTYQFFARSVYRSYISLVWGDLKGYGTITSYIGKRYHKKKHIIPFSNINYGRYSITHYKIIETFNIVTLVSSRIDTGRTHQIRTHFSQIGHPIFNDSNYLDYNNEQKKIIKNYLSIFQMHFLHAQSFIFIHPILAKPLHFAISLPKRMYDVLKKLKMRN